MAASVYSRESWAVRQYADKGSEEDRSEIQYATRKGKGKGREGRGGGVGWGGKGLKRIAVNSGTLQGSGRRREGVTKIVGFQTCCMIFSTD